MDTTVESVLDRVRRDALLTLRGEFLTLDQPAAAGGGTLVCAEEVDGIGPGTIVAVDAELCYVRTIDNATRTLNVLNGFFGTATAIHAEGALVEVSPRAPKATLLALAEEEVRSWGTQLWRAVAIDVTVPTGTRTTDFDVVDTGFLFLLDVRRQPDTRTDLVYADAWPRLGGSQVLVEMDTVAYQAGYALQLHHGGPAVLRVTYAAPFVLDDFTLPVDLVEEVGLATSMLDLLEAGVRWRALSAGLFTRTDSRAAGMSRDSDEVTVLDVIRSVDMAKAIRDRRLAEEAVNLRARYPYRSSG